MGDSSDFESGQIIGARLAGASMTKTATLLVLGISRATVSEVMLVYTNRGKRTSAKRNSGRKSTLQRDGRTTAAQVIKELNIHVEDLVSTKTVRCKLHKSNIHGRLQFLNL
jgi:hypothetical protein